MRRYSIVASAVLIVAGVFASTIQSTADFGTAARAAEPVAANADAVRRMVREKREAMKKLDAEVGAVLDAMERDPGLYTRLRSRILAGDSKGTEDLLRGAGATRSDIVKSIDSCLGVEDCRKCGGGSVTTFSLHDGSAVTIFFHPCYDLPLPPDP